MPYSQYLFTCCCAKVPSAWTCVMSAVCVPAEAVQLVCHVWQPSQWSASSWTGIMSAAFWVLLAAAAAALHLLLASMCQLASALSPERPPLGLNCYSMWKVSPL